MTQPMLERRGQLYRQALGHLTDEQWGYAVKDVIASLDWFPSVRQLLDAADRAPASALLALPEDTRTVEERRAEFKRGFDEHLKPALCERGIHFSCEHAPVNP